MVYGLIEDFTE